MGGQLGDGPRAVAYLVLHAGPEGGKGLAVAFGAEYGVVAEAPLAAARARYLAVDAPLERREARSVASAGCF